jgi:putative ABC transport system permease protein
MFRNYLKIAWRNLSRHKANSIINISGLAIGMAAGILTLLWVQNELSYDKFNKNAGQIFRITLDASGFKAAVNPAGMPAGLKAQMPVIKNTVRLSGAVTTLFEVNNQKFLEKRVFYADPSFMDVFSYQLAKGDRNTALKRVDGVLITQDMARKYFGSQDPIGKVLRKDNWENVIVTGVLANAPSNSHLQFDFILPMVSLARTDGDLKNNVWDNFNYYSYLQLDNSFVPTASALAGLEQQVDKIYHKVEPKIKVIFHLQSLTSIHLEPALQVDLPGHGNSAYVSIFFIVAVLILLVACINFMNLTTARSARRAKEIGLRKVSGAIRGQLIFQFIAESVFISFFALMLALVVVLMSLPAFKGLAGKTLYIDFSDFRLWLTLLGIALVTGLLSGSYPALFLSGFNPVKVLKGNTKAIGGNLLLRNILVVTQFVVSIVLLVGTITIYSQLKFIRERNPGFAKDNLLYMQMTGNLGLHRGALETELKQNPLTSNYTVTSDLPINLITGTLELNWEGKAPRSQVIIPYMFVDENFLSTFKMQLLSGRGFSRSFTADSNNYVINEKMSAIMGLTPANAVGKPLSFGKMKGYVTGVIKDFNFKPVQQAIEPMVLGLNKYGGYVVVRAPSARTPQTIDALSKICRQLNPAYPFQYDFLDQELAGLYKGEQQNSNIFNLFAGLAIFISCLGLYGLSAFIAEQRTKEIGIRKVLGASVANLVYLLSAGITRLVLISIVIAIPLSWYAADTWLEGFTYHIHIGWLVFLIASISALTIAWLTVAYESFKAAIVNPVKSLKAE